MEFQVAGRKHVSGRHNLGRSSRCKIGIAMKSREYHIHLRKISLSFTSVCCGHHCMRVLQTQQLSCLLRSTSCSSRSSILTFARAEPGFYASEDESVEEEQWRKGGEYEWKTNDSKVGRDMERRMRWHLYELRALQVLGLDDTATRKDVKEAYRRLAKIYHPDLFHSWSDKNPGIVTNENRHANKTTTSFIEIKDAFETLTHTDKRRTQQGIDKANSAYYGSSSRGLSVSEQLDGLRRRAALRKTRRRENRNDQTSSARRREPDFQHRYIIQQQLSRLRWRSRHSGDRRTE